MHQENAPAASSNSCSTKTNNDYAHTFQAGVQRDVASYLARQTLEGARAAQSTILAERRLIRRQVRESEIRLRLLSDEAEVIESRLTAATHQLGNIRREIRDRG